MSGKIVCLDLNGVLLDTQAGLRAYAAKRCGVVIPPLMSCKDAVGKTLENVVRGGWKKPFDAANYKTLKDEFFGTTSLFLRAPPMQGAPEALTALVNRGFVLQIVSDCATLTIEQITAWLEQNKFPHDHINIILTRKRHPKEPHQCRCDIVVDNEIEQLAPLLLDTGGPVPIHFLSRRESSSADRTSMSPFIISFRGWEEVLAFILGTQEPARVVQAA